jgi:phosphoribosylanthranilate isomerase|tara:strand:+ start:52240 stop:52887 length:648 start_codon:yes stop_codon:yes gene_type:complete
MPTCQVKICGITTPAAAETAIRAGADFIGLVFHPASPRNIDPIKAIALIRYIRALSTTTRCVGLFVDPSDQELDAVSSYLDMIQLHGDESTERCLEIKQRYERPIIKAIAMSTAVDLTQIKRYEPLCDWLLFDAKPSDSSKELTGGNGVNFDWTLLQGQDISAPWMLAGGLTPDNVAQAAALLRPNAVDVSSGVESTRGVKDNAEIKAFIAAAKT